MALWCYFNWEYIFKALSSYKFVNNVRCDVCRSERWLCVCLRTPLSWKPGDENYNSALFCFYLLRPYSVRCCYPDCNPGHIFLGPPCPISMLVPTAGLLRYIQRWEGRDGGRQGLLSVWNGQGVVIYNVGMVGPSILAGIVGSVVGRTKLGLFDWRQNMMFSFCFRKKLQTNKVTWPLLSSWLVWAAVNE